LIDKQAWFSGRIQSSLNKDLHEAVGFKRRNIEEMHPKKDRQGLPIGMQVAPSRGFSSCHESSVSDESRKREFDFHIFTWDTWFISVLFKEVSTRVKPNFWKVFAGFPILPFVSCILTPASWISSVLAVLLQDFFELLFADAHRPFAKEMVGLPLFAAIRDVISEIMNDRFLDHIAQGPAWKSANGSYFKEIWWPFLRRDCSHPRLLHLRSWIVPSPGKKNPPREIRRIVTFS
jgi:hypothetical protein